MKFQKFSVPKEAIPSLVSALEPTPKKPWSNEGIKKVLDRFEKYWQKLSNRRSIPQPLSPKESIGGPEDRGGWIKPASSTQ